jgi:riboflavin kinase
MHPLDLGGALVGCPKVRVAGVVFSGRGEGSFYVSIYAKQFEKVIGYRPYPGTLNIRLQEDDARRLSECLSKARASIVEPPRIEGAKLGGVYVYRARVYKGIDYWDAYIVRPMITHYRGDVVELIAEGYLREILKVKDGDKLVLEVECC